jgi:arylsulfatase
VFSGVGEGVRVGRDSGRSVTVRYRSPFPLTGATMRQVIADVSGKPYLDLEMAAAAAFSRD